MVKIEVGKSYVTRKDEFSRRKPYIVRIIGKVIPGTIEYERGFRFFSSDGSLYTEEGGSFESVTLALTRPWSSTKSSIIREITLDDLSDYVKDTSHIELDNLENSDNYISRDDDRFIMLVGGVYVNRFGFLGLCRDKVFYPESDRSIFHMVGYAFRSVRDTGLFFSRHDKPSMRDIIYQRI